MLSAAEFVAALRQHHLLEPEQLAESEPLAASTEPKALAKELLQRGWLTAYQANHILQGKAGELVLGSYVLLERLGEGGMGQVFKARHQMLGRVVALKLIRPERLSNPAAVKRFRKEIQAAAQLNHPNVVRAFDADRAGGTHFLVMEYVEGHDLDKQLKQHGPLPIDKTCDYIRQTACGLAHAQAQGLIHRDIKPGNLLVTTTSVVKILDMGLARFRSPDSPLGESSSHLTQEGAVMGSLDYMAPEQAEDARQADIRADLYSLGCTFYQLLTGQVPFPGGSMAQKILKHRFDEPTPVEQLRPEVPPEVAVVVRKLMTKQPADRYQTPTELADALTQLANRPRPSASEASLAGARARTERAETAANRPTGHDAADSPGQSTMTTPVTRNRERRQAERQRWLKLNLIGAAALLACVGLLVILLSQGGSGPPKPTEPRAAAPPPPDREPPPARPALPPLAETAWVSDPAPLRGVESWTLTCRTGQAFVKVLAIDPQGRWLATAHDDPVIRLVDLQTGQLFRALVGHRDTIRDLVWSADGRYLASIAADSRTRIWDSAAGWRPLVIPIGANAASWSPQGTVLMLRHYDGYVSLREGNGKTVKNYGVLPNLKEMAWAADGRSLEAGGANKVLRGWSPDGRTFAATQPGGKIQLSGAQSMTFQAHPGKVVGALAWSPDGRYLATGGEDSTVKLWDAETLQLNRTMPVGKYGVFALAWSADSRLLATGNNDGRVRVWDVASGAQRFEMTGHGEPSRGRSWSPDGQFIASGSFHIWDMTSGEQVRRWSPPGGGTGAVAWSADGRFLAADTYGGPQVYVWETATGKLARTLHDPKQAGYPVLAWSPRVLALAVSSVDPTTVFLWDGESGKLLQSLSPPGPRVTALAWSPDSQRLATASEDKSILLWQADTGERLRSLDGPQAPLRCLAWSPDGQRLAGGEKESLWLWQADTGRVRSIGFTNIVSMNGHDITAISWSPDGRELTALGSEGRLWTWETATWELRNECATSARRGHFAPDGRLIAYGNPAFSLRLWDTETGRVRITWHNLNQGPLAVSPDGHYRCSPEVEAELVYVVQTATGQETLTPAEFAQQFGWTNDPERVRPKGP